MLDAISVRQKSRRVCEPHVFVRPPRVKMSRNRTNAWLVKLADRNTSLTELARAIPFVLNGTTLLNCLVESQIPLNRAVWVIQCVCSTDVRAYAQRNLPEKVWGSEWTDLVLKYVETVFNDSNKTRIDAMQSPLPAALSPVCTPSFPIKLRYISNLLVHLFDHLMLDRQQFVCWILRGISYGSCPMLPCYKLLVDLFWNPITQTSPHLLVRAIARRLAASKSDQEMLKLQSFFRPVLLHLDKNDELQLNALLMPDLWTPISACLQETPIFADLERRNRAFMTFDGKSRSKYKQLATIMDAFAFPYDLNSLETCLLGLDWTLPDLVNALLLYTVYKGTTASFVVCTQVLLSLDKPVVVQNVCAEFLLDLNQSCRGLNGLVESLVRSNLLNVDLYLTRVIARELLLVPLHLHLQIVESIPLNVLKPNTRSLVNMALQRSGQQINNTDLRPFVNHGLSLLTNTSMEESQESQGSQGSQGRESMSLLTLPVDKASEISDELVKQFSAVKSTISPSSLRAFIDFLCPDSSASHLYLSAVLCAALNGPSELALASIVLFNEHIAALVCSNQADVYAEAVINRLRHQKDAIDEFNSDAENFGLLKSVVKNPNTLHSLNCILPNPCRRFNAVTTTPAERVSFAQTLEDSANSRGNWKLSLPTLLSFSDDDEFLPLLRERLIATTKTKTKTKTNPFNKAVVLRFIAYGIIKIESLLTNELLRFLLFEPVSEYAILPEEIDLISKARSEYINSLDFAGLVNLMGKLSTQECAFDFVYYHLPTFAEKVVKPCINNEPNQKTLFTALQINGKAFNPTTLLQQCTAYTLDFYFGIASILFSGSDMDTLIDGLYSSVLQECSQRYLELLTDFISSVSLRLQARILTKCITKFLLTPYDQITVRAIETHCSIFCTLTEKVPEPLDWLFENVWTYLHFLRDEVMQDLCEEDEMVKVNRTLTFLVQIIVMRRRNTNFDIVGLLKSFTNSPTNQLLDDKLRHFVMDAILVLERKDSVQPSLPSTRTSMLDGLALFSRSTKMYEPLPILATDLIMETNQPQPDMCNNRPIDLFLFETYRLE